MQYRHANTQCSKSSFQCKSYLFHLAINKDDFNVMGNICIDYTIVGYTLPIIEALNSHSHLSLQDLDIIVTLHLKQAIGL